MVDRPIDSLILRHLGSHGQTLFTISKLGDGHEIAVLTAVLVVACLVARRVNGALLALCSVPITVALTEYVIKPLVHRTLGESLTYPSGHTSSLFTLIAVVAVLMLGPPRNRPRPVVRLLIVLGLLLVGCVVAVAVIGLEFHYFTDTIAGAALATGVVLAVAFPLDWAAIRRRLAFAYPSWRRGPSGDG